MTETGLCSLPLFSISLVIQNTRTRTDVQACPPVLSFAWKEQTGGWELLGYKADKAKTKVCLGKVRRLFSPSLTHRESLLTLILPTPRLRQYLSGTNSMKADSTGTVEATNDPRLAELCFIVIFAVEDDMVSPASPTLRCCSRVRR